MLNHTLLITTLLCTPMAASAQEDHNGITFRIGAGPLLKPGYFGDDSYGPALRGKFRVDQLRFGPVAAGGESELGFGFGGSVRFIGSRTAEKFDELTGLEDIDASLEFGGGLEYIAPNYDVFAKLRYGVIGHGAFVAELGSDVLFRPTDQLTIKAGPRLLVGDDDYAQTYFGVSEGESAASSFDAFDAQAGLMTAGVELEATYAINDTWDVIGIVAYEQLQGDAADSPITASDDQLSARLVVTRRVTFGF